MLGRKPNLNPQLNMQILAGKSRLNNPNTQSASQNLLISLLKQKKRNEEESHLQSQLMMQNLKILEQDDKIKIVQNVRTLPQDKIKRKQRSKSNARKQKNLMLFEKNFERNSQVVTQQNEQLKTIGSTLTVQPKNSRTHTQKSPSRDRSPKNEQSLTNEKEKDVHMPDVRQSNVRKSKQSPSQKSNKSLNDYKHVRSSDKNFISVTLKDLKNPQVVFLQQSQQSQAIVDVISGNSTVNTKLLRAETEKVEQIIQREASSSFQNIRRTKMCLDSTNSIRSAKAQSSNESRTAKESAAMTTQRVEPTQKLHSVLGNLKRKPPREQQRSQLVSAKDMFIKQVNSSFPSTQINASNIVSAKSIERVPEDHVTDNQQDLSQTELIEKKMSKTDDLQVIMDSPKTQELIEDPSKIVEAFSQQHPISTYLKSTGNSRVRQKAKNSTQGHGNQKHIALKKPLNLKNCNIKLSTKQALLTELRRNQGTINFPLNNNGMRNNFMSATQNTLKDTRNQMHIVDYAQRIFSSQSKRGAALKVNSDYQPSNSQSSFNPKSVFFSSNQAQTLFQGKKLSNGAQSAQGSTGHMSSNEILSQERQLKQTEPSFIIDNQTSLLDRNDLNRSSFLENHSPLPQPAASKTIENYPRNTRENISPSRVDLSLPHDICKKKVELASADKTKKRTVLTQKSKDALNKLIPSILGNVTQDREQNKSANDKENEGRKSRIVVAYKKSATLGNGRTQEFNLKVIKGRLARVLNLNTASTIGENLKEFSPDKTHENQSRNMKRKNVYLKSNKSNYYSNFLLLPSTIPVSQEASNTTTNRVTLMPLEGTDGQAHQTIQAGENRYQIRRVNINGKSQESHSQSVIDRSPVRGKFFPKRKPLKHQKQQNLCHQQVRASGPVSQQLSDSIQKSRSSIVIDRGFIALNEALNADKDLNENNSAYGLARASSDLQIGPSVLNPIGMNQSTSMNYSYLSTPNMQDGQKVFGRRFTPTYKTKEDIVESNHIRHEKADAIRSSEIIFQRVQQTDGTLRESKSQEASAEGDAGRNGLVQTSTQSLLQNSQDEAQKP